MVLHNDRTPSAVHSRCTGANHRFRVGAGCGWQEGSEPEIMIALMNKFVHLSDEGKRPAVHTAVNVTSGYVPCVAVCAACLCCPACLVSASMLCVRVSVSWSPHVCDI